MDAVAPQATENQLSTDAGHESVALARQRWAQDQWITFCAANGMSYDEDGNFKTVTVSEFAAAIGYNRTTLYRWKKDIPDFWQQVDQRAKQIFNHQVKYAIFKGQTLKAMAGDTKAAEFVLGHYSDYTPPAQKHEVKLTGWGDMVREARNASIKNNRPVQEGEVIGSTPPTAPPIPSSLTPQVKPEHMNPPLPTPTHQNPPLIPAPPVAPTNPPPIVDQPTIA